MSSSHNYSADGYDPSSFIGLGYHAASNGGNNHHHPTVSSATDATVLVDTILQQCLAYHQEQEAVRCQQQQVHREMNNSRNEFDDVQFVSATHTENQQQHDVSTTKQQPMGHANYDTNTESTIYHQSRNESNDGYPTISISDQEQPQQPTTNYSIEESVLRAQAILARFHQQQQNLLSTYDSCNISNNDNHDPIENSRNINTMTVPDDNSIQPSVFAQQRIVGLEREKIRTKSALLHNLEYIQRKDDARIQQLEQKVQESDANENLAAQKYSLHVQNRTQRIVTAGIGTRERKKVEQQTMKTERKKQQATFHTVAIYVSGLPIQPETKVNDMETMVQQLFRPFGTIQKIHLYRVTKSTSSMLKGDGLVIYSCPLVEQFNLIETVCGQMNGAELGCGNVLHVESASSNMQSNFAIRQVQTSTNSDATTEDKMITHNSSQPNCNVDDPHKGQDHDNDDELDEFFDAL